MKPSVSEFLSLRGLRYHVRLWGAAEAPRLFLLHGWMDVAASFQFLVDAFEREWRVIAPDWRGFGLSDWNSGPYWFPDYLADLDALLAHYSPDAPANLVGASMGGNLACLYAGIRPERVARLATLEGFGLAPSDPDEAPARLTSWLDQLGEEPAVRIYPDFDALSARLRHDNPRLGPDAARFLARHLGRERDDGGVEPAADPSHKLVNPILYRIEEVKACWRRVTAPVLWVVARNSPVMKRFIAHEDDYRARLACFRELREVVVEDAGHNLHHDQPRRVAALIEEFLAD